MGGTSRPHDRFADFLRQHDLVQVQRVLLSPADADAPVARATDHGDPGLSSPGLPDLSKAQGWIAEWASALKIIITGWMVHGNCANGKSVLPSEHVPNTQFFGRSAGA